MISAIMTMEMVTKNSPAMTMPTIAPELSPLLVSIITKVTTFTLSVRTVNPACVNLVCECVCNKTFNE